MLAAIDIHTLSGPAQGISTYTRHLVEEAAIDAPDIEFMTLAAPGTAPMLRDLPNIRREKWRGGVGARVGWDASRQTRRHACTAYHTSYWLPAVLPRNPLVTLHDILPNTHPQYFTPRFRFAAQHWFRYSARNATHVFTDSNYSRDTIMELYRVPADRISITPCAVDLAHYQGGAAGNPADIHASLRSQNYFLIVGRFDPRKDHATALRALARLIARHRDFPLLVIAGSHGSMEETIRARIAQPDLAGRVLLLKNVSHVNLPVLYAHALATITPSVGEGFGLPSLEAMAAGSPAICADNTAQSELVKDYGLLFETGSDEALADCMLRVATQEDLRTTLRTSGQKRALEYTWRDSARALTRVLRQLA